MNESNEVIVNNFIDTTVKNKVKSNKKNRKSKFKY